MMTTTTTMTTKRRWEVTCRHWRCVRARTRVPLRVLIDGCCLRVECMSSQDARCAIAKIETLHFCALMMPPLLMQPLSLCAVVTERHQQQWQLRPLSLLPTQTYAEKLLFRERAKFEFRKTQRTT
jgi:hypothetical protein